MWVVNLLLILKIGTSLQFQQPFAQSKRCKTLKSVEYECGWTEIEDPLQGQRVHIKYSAPSADYFRDESLALLAQFRAEEASSFVELDESSITRRLECIGNTNQWQTVLLLPLGVRQIVFAVTDGVRFDTNENEYFRISLPYFFEPRKGTESFELFRTKDKQSLGLIHRRSATELEDATRSALAQEQQNSLQEEASTSSTTEIKHSPKIQSQSFDVKEDHLDFEHLQVAISKEEQAAFQDIRAKTSALGESLGLSNVEVGDVRMAFERHTSDRCKSDAPLFRSEFDAFLCDLGFDQVVQEQRQHALWNEFAGETNLSVSLENCIRIYHALDAAGEGLAMV